MPNSVVYRYTVSKRTMWYTQYAKIDNNSAGAKNFPYYPVPGTAPGSDRGGFASGCGTCSERRYAAGHARR